MKAGTAPGPDHISPDLLRAGGHRFHKILAAHMTSYLQKERIPNQWRTSRTILLYKKCDCGDIWNYRQICLLSVLHRLFIKIFFAQTSRMRPNPKSEIGFAKTFVLPSSTTKKLLTASRQAPCCQFCWPRSEYILMRTLADYYKNCSTAVRVLDRLLPTPIRKGVRQCDNISPKLSTAALQWIMKSLKWDERDIRVDGQFLSNLHLADDVFHCKEYHWSRDNAERTKRKREKF